MWSWISWSWMVDLHRDRWQRGREITLYVKCLIELFDS